MGWYIIFHRARPAFTCQLPFEACYDESFDECHNSTVSIFIKALKYCFRTDLKICTVFFADPGQWFKFYWLIYSYRFPSVIFSKVFSLWSHWSLLLYLSQFLRRRSSTLLPIQSSLAESIQQSESAAPWGRKSLYVCPHQLPSLCLSLFLPQSHTHICK